MTRAEYLEFVEEQMAFPPLDTADSDINPLRPDMMLCHALRDTPEVVQALREAHEQYCRSVSNILFPGREYSKGEL